MGRRNEYKRRVYSWHQRLKEREKRWRRGLQYCPLCGRPMSISKTEIPEDIVEMIEAATIASSGGTIVDIKKFAEELGISTKTARKKLDTLVKQGYLRRIKFSDETVYGIVEKKVKPILQGRVVIWRLKCQKCDIDFTVALTKIQGLADAYAKLIDFLEASPAEA